VPSGVQLALVVAQTFGVAAIATWLIRGAARQRGWLAPPRPDRWHREPTALYGGVGIFAGFAVGLLWHVPWSPFMAALLVLTGAMFVTGLVDDATDIRPQTKIVLQLVGGLLLYAADFHFNSAFAWWLDMGIVVFWVVAITNAMNLLDNMDGLSAGVAAIAALFFLLFAAISKQYLVGALAAALVGACVGFLFYNLNPASIFMGDTGSLFLGFTLAAVGIKLRFPDNSAFVTWMVPVLALGLPILDTTLVVISRLRRGKNPLTTPGKDHISHRLARVTGSRREAVLMCYLIGGIFGMISIFITTATVVEGYLVGLAVAGIAAYAIWWLETKVGYE